MGGDLKIVDQALDAGETEAQTFRGRKARLKGPGNIRNTGPLVTGGYDDPLPFPMVGKFHHDFPTPGVQNDVSRQLGNRRGNEGDLSRGEAQPPGQLAPLLAGLDDVAIAQNGDRYLLRFGLLAGGGRGSGAKGRVHGLPFIA